jgi:hypothetical protein
MGDEHVEVTLLLKKDDFQRVERISRRLGIEPSFWMSFALSNKLKEMAGEEKGV